MEEWQLRLTKALPMEAQGVEHTGFRALQINAIAGQVHGDRNGSDLYFTTQDNDTWSSADNGLNWPASYEYELEGNFLQSTQIASTSNNSNCRILSFGSTHGVDLSVPLFKNKKGKNLSFQNSATITGTPALISAGSYVQNSQITPLNYLGAAYSGDFL